MREVYVSDITGRQYDTKDECLKAENAVSTEKLERKEAAKKVNEKLDAYDKARKEAIDELDKFNGKYGAFNTSVRHSSLFSTPFDWVLDKLFENW